MTANKAVLACPGHIAGNPGGWKMSLRQIPCLSGPLALRAGGPLRSPCHSRRPPHAAWRRPNAYLLRRKSAFLHLWAQAGAGKRGPRGRNLTKCWNSLHLPCGPACLPSGNSSGVWLDS